MYKQIATLLIVCLSIATASPGNAEMAFTADADQDGRADAVWPLATGDAVTVDIRVSDIAEPGLGAMGFTLTYDETRLTVLSANVDAANWPSGDFPTADHESVPGEIHFLGNRIPETTGISGDDIRLATATFKRIAAGVALLQLIDRDLTQDDFVTLDDPIQVLDGDIGVGVVLMTILSPVAGDVNVDRIVDLADAVAALQLLSGIDGTVRFTTGDVDGDETIGMVEVIWIMQRVAKLR